MQIEDRSNRGRGGTTPGLRRPLYFGPGTSHSKGLGVGSGGGTVGCGVEVLAMLVSAAVLADRFLSNLSSFSSFCSVR